MRATFRFHGSLNDFLPSCSRDADIAFEAPWPPSLKDAIESLGPPHPEVGAILANGAEVTLADAVPHGARIDVHPRPPGLHGAAPRFLLDVHLRKLAVYLRLLGLDAAWSADGEDAHLAARSASDGLILLTRDLGLLKRAVVVHGRFVRATDPIEQIREMVRVFALDAVVRPFSRCLRCGDAVVPVAKQDIVERLLPGTRRSYHRFRMCAGCDRIFWRGAHFARLAAVVRRVLPEAEIEVMSDEHWWESFFSGLWLDVQRTIFDDEATAGHAAFCADVLGLVEGRHVLDAPCGNGRISLDLAERGCIVTGVDRCGTLIEEARSSATERGLDATFVQGDLRDGGFDGTFDAVINFWGSFGYFDDVGNMEHARVAARALRPGGRLLIDGHATETIFPKFDERGWVRIGDIDLLEHRTWDAAAGRLDAEWTLIRGTEREVHHSSIRMYSYRELVCLLESVGFTDFAAFGDRSAMPFGVGSKRLCLVATKG